MDEPAAGPGLFPQYIVSRLAARHVKVCLGGQGGDEIFGGYARYVIAYLEQALKGAIYGDSRRRASTRRAGGHCAEPALHPAVRAAADALLAARACSSSTERRYFALMDRSEGALDAYSAAFRRRYDREAVFARFEQVFHEPDTDSVLQPHAALRHGDQPAVAAAGGGPRQHGGVARVARAAAGLPHRGPASRSVPPAIKFKGGEMKYLFKAAIA